MSDHMQAPDDRRYSPNHVWVKKEGEMCQIGISDYAQDQLGQIVYVNLPESGSIFGENQDFGAIESVKTVNQLLMPIAGKVEEANSDLESDPALVNNDCYGKGWLIKVKPDGCAGYDKLLDAEAYRRLLNESNR